MAELYGVDVRTINEPIRKIYADNELPESATVRNFRIVQIGGCREVLANVGHISAELIKTHAESEWEKYRIVQDRLYTSDFDSFFQLEERAADKEKGGEQ